MSFPEFLVGFILIIIFCLLVKACICIFKFCTYNANSKRRKSSTTAIISRRIDDSETAQSNPSAPNVTVDRRCPRISHQQQEENNEEQIFTPPSNSTRRLSEIVIHNGQLLVINYPEANAHVQIKAEPQQHSSVTSTSKVFKIADSPPPYSK